MSVARKLRAAPFDGEDADREYAHHNTLWLPEFHDHFIFMTVRHPYLRMLSFWRFFNDKLAKFRRGEIDGKDWKWWNRAVDGKRLTFQGFLDYEVMQEPFQTAWSCGWHLQVIEKPIDAIVRLEHFYEDIAKIALLRGVDFGHLNAGPVKGKAWHEYFTPDNVIKVQELWPDDFEQFGYNKDFTECRQGKLFV